MSILKDVILDVQDKSDVYEWGCLDVDFLIHLIEKSEYMFGDDGVVDFTLLDNYGVDPTELNNYIYLALEHYCELFYEEAFELARSVGDYPTIEALNTDYENINIYVNYFDSGIDVLPSEAELLDYDSVSDYIDYLRSIE